MSQRLVRRSVLGMALGLGLGAVAGMASPALAQTAAAKASKLDARAVAQGYSQLVYANYSDSLASARDMQTAIAAFLRKTMVAVPSVAAVLALAYWLHNPSWNNKSPLTSMAMQSVSGQPGELP